MLEYPVVFNNMFIGVVCMERERLGGLDKQSEHCEEIPLRAGGSSAESSPDGLSIRAEDEKDVAEFLSI